MSAAVRVSADDLAFAAEWLDAHDGGPDGADEDAAARRVSAWLRAEIARRAEDAEVRRLVAKYECSPARARAALRKHNPSRKAS